MKEILNTKTFNANYELVKGSRRGLKAVPKNSRGYPERLTGDGIPFNPENKYHFFDESTQKPRETIGLRRIDIDWLGSFGLRIVRIENLRADKRDALSDGQKFFEKQIDALHENINQLEAQKKAMD